ncbi:MAG: alpha/beta hydrolase family protein [Streptosporangiaceae bacterium]
MRWIDTPEHDIDCAALSADGGTLAWGINEDGYTTLRTCRVKTITAVPVAGLPRSSYTRERCLDGRALQLRADGGTLFAVDRSGALWAAYLADRTARRLTSGAGTALPLPDVVRFTSADGVSVPGLLYRPPGQGPFPAVLHIHGGPEDQAVPVTDPLIDGLVGRGIAVLATNIRGSSGYGARYQRMVYRDWAGNDIEDLRAAADFIRAQPWADPDRIGVYGASYGGLASLSCLTRLPEYWRAGVAECPVSDLVENVRGLLPAWQRRAKDLVGDVNDADDLRRLRQASPVTHAERVRAPILLIHGTNDTRVSINTSDALYTRLTELGKTVTYKRIDGAGHDIIQQESGIETAICDWLAQNLLPNLGDACQGPVTARVQDPRRSASDYPDRRAAATRCPGAPAPA